MAASKGRKPRGYWSEFENVRSELEPIINELGYFPTTVELNERGQSSLAAAISQYHGGIDQVRKRIGIDQTKPPVRGLWPDFEIWRQYGTENGYHERHATDLKNSDEKEERSWYRRGQTKKWLKKFKFSKYKRKVISFNEWVQQGRERDYDQRNSSSLKNSKSKKERSWYNSGSTRRWIKHFPFKRIRLDGMWETEEEWEQYGLEQKFNERNPASLEKSRNKEERSWYNKGLRKDWISDFNFLRVHENTFWQDFESWEEYGLEKNYGERNPASLEKSRNKEERSWYNKGWREGWVKRFSFTNRNVRWGDLTLEQWIEMGMERGFNERNPASLSDSEEDEERSWYNKGGREGWLEEFDFSRERLDGMWETEEEWEQYGLEQKFNERNPANLSKSKDKEEKAWYNKGAKNGWVREFPFKRLIGSMTKSQFISFLQHDEKARNLAAASVALEKHGNSGYDLEKILYDMHGDRFADQSRVHELIQESREEIIRLAQEGFTNLGAYLGEYTLEDFEAVPILLGQALNGLTGHKISYDLETRLVGVLRNAHGPSFNSNPKNTLRELRRTVKESPRELKRVYKRLISHYEEVLKLKGELENE